MWRQRVLPGWKSNVLFSLGTVAFIRVLAFPETDYDVYMWVAIFYCWGLPVARTIDKLRAIAEEPQEDA